MGHKVPTTEAQVHASLNYISSFLFSNDRASFQLRLNELQELQKNLISQEQELYQIFNVSDINQLNDRINQCQGLMNLGGAKLSKSIHATLVDDSAKSLDTLMATIVSSSIFQTAVANQIETKIKITPEIIQNIIKSIYVQTGTKFQMKQGSKIVGLAKLLEGAVYEVGTSELILKASEQTIDSNTIKRIRDAFAKVKAVDTQNGAKATFLTPTEKNRQIYAGWKINPKFLNEEEKIRIRQKILDYCIALMKNPSGKEVAAFTKVYNTVKFEDLIIHDLSGLQGLIGEMAAAALIEILTNGNGSIVLTGKLFSSGTSTQTAIDILLSHYGFQIKNYNEFSSQLQMNNVISLDRTNSLKTWQTKFELNDSLKMALDTFYAIKGFNIQVTENYTAINHIEAVNNNLKNFYLQYPDKILRLYDDIQGFDPIKPEKYQHFYNVFWLFSGKKFVPSSVILQHIINYFSNLNTETLLQGMSLNTSSSYSGMTYKDLYYSPFTGTFEDNAPTITEIANETSVTIRWRMHLDTILSNITAGI